MAPTPRSEAHLSPPQTDKLRRGTPSDRSDRSDQSPDSSEKGYTSSLRSTESRPTRKRASRPKVRTGCISCKKRHVKCGEERPACAECERLGIFCEGYAPPKVKRAAVRTERALLPKLSSSVSQPATRTNTPPLRSASGQSTILPALGPGFELVDEDGWYFTLFRDQVAHELSPCHHSSFWSETSLRDSIVNRCIRHSILSIGAYARALIELREEYPWSPNMAHPWWPPTVLNRHHQSALVHHAKALSYLRSDIERYGVDGRTTMAATLLFIVFEYMQGNYHSSGNLIRHGIKVLSNIRGTSGGPESTLHHQRSRYLAATRDEIDEMADMFARHSTACAYIPFAHGKFAYHLLFTEEDKDELDYQGFPDGPDPYTFDVPQTLEQARRKWDYLLPLLANFHNKAVWHNLHRDYDFDDESSFREQALYLAQLRDFGEALDSLVLFSSGDSRDSRALELLRLHHRLATIFMQCCLDATDMTYDDFLPQFRDVLRRCRALTGALSSAAAAVATPTRAAIKVGFTNEAGVLFLLAFVGVKCRARRVRLEVLDLLRRHEWREGGWDGTTLASVLKGLMRLEGQSPTADDGLDIGGPAVGVGVNSTETEVFPLPETRYTWTNMFWDFEHRRMSVEYTRVLPNSIGKHERMTHVMDA